jgi:hypothetical protein
LTPLVVIHDLDICWTGVGPYEADSPLIVDANAVLPFAVTPQSFQVIPRRRLHEVQGLGRIQLRESPLCDGQERLEPARALALVKRQGVFALERLDHAPSILRTA